MYDIMRGIVSMVTGKALPVKAIDLADGTGTCAASVSMATTLDPVNDAVGAVPVTGQVMSGATSLTPKFALANINAGTTDGSIVALVALKKFRVLALIAKAGGTATAITFQSNTTPISALFANAANGDVTLPFNPCGWFETAAGEALKATTGAGAATGISVVYVEV